MQINIYDNLLNGKAIFNTDVASCIITLDANNANGYTKLLKTSEDFYDYISAETNIAGSANTIKVVPAYKWKE